MEDVWEISAFLVTCCQPRNAWLLARRWKLPPAANFYSKVYAMCTHRKWSQAVDNSSLISILLRQNALHFQVRLLFVKNIHKLSLRKSQNLQKMVSWVRIGAELTQFLLSTNIRPPTKLSNSVVEYFHFHIPKQK